MCIELWDSGQWFRITEDKDAFEWIDATQLRNVPVLIPADDDFRALWREKHPDSDISLMPQYMQYIPDKDVMNDLGEVVARAGEPQTKKAVFDIDVSIGEGLPTNKLAIFNLFQSLAQIQLYDEQTGTQRPLIGYNQFRKMVEDILGMSLDEQEIMYGEIQNQSNNQGLKPININPNTPGTNLRGQNNGQIPVV
jgi:hypothetical protein